MIICFDCSSVTKAELDELLQSGDWNLNEIITVAIGNLAVLHRRVGRGGALVLDGTEASADGVSASGDDSSVGVQRSEGMGTKSAVAQDLLPPTEPPSRFASLPDDKWGKGQPVPIDRWVFGQYNRLLPAKVNCRILAHMLTRQPKGVELTKATSHIVRAVADLRVTLERVDTRYELDRDNALATGFPKAGHDSEKGRLRYANQFVAAVNKAGQVSGLLIELKLINYIPAKNPRLLLTEAGWEFAVLHNPVIEGGADRPVGRLTTAEQDFLLNHIGRHVPAEHFAYQTILEAVASGAATPGELDAAVMKHVSVGKDLNPAFLSSQRSGAVARMCDLGLLARAREGVRVSYIVTERGHAYRNRA